MYKTIAKLVGNTERTIFAWKKEQRPIINLLEKYFSKQELEEFLSTGKITKLEKNELANKLFSNIDYEFVENFLLEGYPKLKPFYYLFLDSNNDYLSLHKLNDRKIFKLFKEEKLDYYDVEKYLSTNVESPMLTYIDYNIKNNWEIFYRAEVNSTYKTFHKFLLKVAELNIYDKLLIDGYVPAAPMYYQINENHDDFKEFESIITTIYNKIVNDAFNYDEAPQIPPIESVEAYTSSNKLYIPFRDYYLTSRKAQK